MCFPHLIFLPNFIKRSENITKYIYKKIFIMMLKIIIFSVIAINVPSKFFKILYPATYTRTKNNTLIQKYILLQALHSYSFFNSYALQWMEYLLLYLLSNFFTLISLFCLFVTAFTYFPPLNDSFCNPDKTVGNETNIPDN